MKKYFVFLATVILLASCENVVQIKLDKGSELIVVDAFINDMRKSQVVRLTTTDDYFTTQNPPALSGATVVLKDLTNNRVYNFSDQNNGDYVFNLTAADTIGYAGHTYKLEVTYNGNMYTSTVNQNRRAKLDSISATFEDGTSLFTPKAGYYAVLWARDLPGPVSDYYWVRSSKNNVAYSKANEINLAIDGTGGSVPANDTLLFTPPIINNLVPFDDVLEVGDTLGVEIHAISKETYYFLVQVINQTNNSGLFATTPENVRTNIVSPANAKKAIGWFSVSGVAAGGKRIK